MEAPACRHTHSPLASLKSDSSDADIPPRTLRPEGPRETFAFPHPIRNEAPRPAKERDCDPSGRGTDVSPLPRASAFGRSPGLQSLGPLGRFRIFRLPLRSRGLLRRDTGFFTARPSDLPGERAGLVTVRASTRPRGLLRAAPALFAANPGDFPETPAGPVNTQPSPGPLRLLHGEVEKLCQGVGPLDPYADFCETSRASARPHELPAGLRGLVYGRIAVLGLKYADRMSGAACFSQSLVIWRKFSGLRRKVSRTSAR
jgi:hypothetical protein